MFSLISRTKKVFSSIISRSLAVLFNNRVLSEKTPREFEEVKATDIKRWPVGSYRLMFVILENGKLVLSKDERTFCGLTGISTSRYHHSDLAGLKPVRAAGEAVVSVIKREKTMCIKAVEDSEDNLDIAEQSNDEKQVVINELNNRSGHYEPQGEHLKGVVEENFSENGFPDAEDKYRQFTFGC